MVLILGIERLINVTSRCDREQWLLNVTQRSCARWTRVGGRTIDITVIVKTVSGFWWWPLIWPWPRQYKTRGRNKKYTKYGESQPWKTKRRKTPSIEERQVETLPTKAQSLSEVSFWKFKLMDRRWRPILWDEEIRLISWLKGFSRGPTAKLMPNFKIAD